MLSNLLVFVGLGYSLKHLTREAIEELRSAEVIYVDTYTSMYEDPIVRIAELNPLAEIVIARRTDLEGLAVKELLEKSRIKKVVLAVPGDPFIATTHDAILADALRQGIEVKTVHGISFVTMVFSRLGLQVYKFGKPVTLVYSPGFKPYSVVDFIYDNLKRNLHTIVLLDPGTEESKATGIPEAVNALMELDYLNLLKDQVAIGIARLGWKDEKICADILPNLRLKNYPPPPHSIVILSKPDPVEKFFVEYWKKKC